MLSKYLFCCLSALSLLTATAHAKEETTTGERVYGWVEKGIVMPLGAIVKMKLDTGALTSSMHADDIEIYTIDADEHGVRFTLELEDQHSGKMIKRRMDLEVERYIIVRGAGGEDRRPVVKLPLCIGDRVYTEQFSLRNRNNMNYPVLLGRRTLQDLGLVNSKATFLTKPECEIPAKRAKKAGKAD
ncbi:MAG: RimK/LysX family protein [Porticoccaceae bacterium]|jgi:hypothetical protein